MGDDDSPKVVETPIHGPPKGACYGCGSHQHEVKRPDMNPGINRRGQEPALHVSVPGHEVFLKIPPPVDFFGRTGDEKKKQGDDPGRGSDPLPVDSTDLIPCKRKDKGGNRFPQKEYSV